MITTSQCERCHKPEAALFEYEPPYARLSAYKHSDPHNRHRPLIYDRKPALLLCADCHNAAMMAAEQRLHRAAPDLLRLSQLILVRLDLEAEERGPNEPFLCAAWRDDLRAAIALAIDEEEPSHERTV